MAKSSAACATSPAERIIRGVIALVLIAVVISAPTNWMAIPIGLFALVMAIAAITGKCPNQYFASSPRKAQKNALGVPDATDIVDIKVGRR
ncbi:MAG: DUF2892 domain-containing protein [Ancrocorticia sp.]|jgi:apolipoprotein N-acyltransferase|nr:DUF2892 domain-containing protein [Ancrocorticia sp.]MCI1896539.1 DUF2892 domain-containing protein [Ancrocorticia sp.]MCI1963114.1 DUF2892 domain-containing protein [Ancrocorticia sp.]MCI2001482.1 DUF2892 domain-containing protein [Ancrocorticia sp.]MCI2013362.1 DUF2892 domain-containing protein [Ancrocorticia sp.]